MELKKNFFLVADRFMEAIEMITSQEKEIEIKDKTTGQKKV